MFLKFIDKIYNLFFSIFDKKVLNVPGGYFWVDSCPRLNIYKRNLNKDLFKGNLNNKDEIIDKYRRLIWREISKAHPPFQACYYKFLREDSNLHINNILNNEFTLIDNFIPPV